MYLAFNSTIAVLLIRYSKKEKAERPIIQSLGHRYGNYRWFGIDVMLNLTNVTTLKFSGLYGKKCLLFEGYELAS